MNKIINKWEFQWHIHRVAICRLFPGRIGIWKCSGFCGGRKTGVPGEKPSEQGQEPTTNSTHIWRQLRESNPGHTDGRRVLSPLHHLCSPEICGIS